ncbi:MAG: gamma-glutamyl-gamma-aminobutyrate hydrolase family protein [Chloroflexota bacterium]|nr:gamma-glutamyl-gamma-aminobutyrate hydrolase family protein [Chloroflexota bacterium]
MSLPVIGITGRPDRSARPPNLPLFAISQPYVQSVELGGGAPVVVPPYVEETRLRAIFEHLDGLILSGGGDISPVFYGEEDGGLLWRVDEQRDRAELALARWALADKLPLLAICRGVQVLNVAAGGTLVQDIPTQLPDAVSHSSPVAGRPTSEIVHIVEVAAGSRIAALAGAGSQPVALVGSGELGVNSAHHQAVKTVGAGLSVTARAPDGVIEGVEAPDHPFCVGVQWHPEVMAESYPEMRRLFEGLVEAARAK